MACGSTGSPSLLRRWQARATRSTWPPVQGAAVATVTGAIHNQGAPKPVVSFMGTSCADSLTRRARSGLGASGTSSYTVRALGDLGDRHYNYLLISESTQRTYNGITNDLERRLRQHRGELPGGAKSTRTASDWEFLAVIHHPDWAAPGTGRRGDRADDSGSGIADGAIGGEGSGGARGKVGKAAAASFEVRLRYPTGKRPRPPRFSGPAGRLASLELVLPTPAEPPADIEGQAGGAITPGPDTAPASPAGAIRSDQSAPILAATTEAAATRTATAAAGSTAGIKPVPIPGKETGSGKGKGRAPEAAEVTEALHPGLWVWVHPRYRHLAGPALRTVMLASPPASPARVATPGAPMLPPGGVAAAATSSECAECADEGHRLLAGLSTEERRVVAFLESHATSASA